MPEKMGPTIAKIEKEAEKIIENARNKAKGMLDHARSNAGSILASDLPMDDVTKERDKIIGKAEEESKKIEDTALRKASQIKATAKTKVDDTVRIIVDYIRGTHT